MLLNKIKQYWEVQPPFKGIGKYGTLNWSKSISKHRFSVVPYWKDFLDTKRYKGKSVLEIGCGAGSDLLEYAKEGANVYGIDITKKAIKTTALRFGLENKQAQLKLYNGRSLLDFKDNSFDMVCSYGVLHHTPYIEDIIADAYRILKPNGCLRLMLYNKNSVLYYYSILYLHKFLEGSSLSRNDLLSKYSEFREGCPYTRCYSEFEVRDMLWYFSMVDVQIDYPVFDGLDPRTRKLSYIGKQFDVEQTGIADVDSFFAVHKGKIGKEFGWHLLVEATK